MFKDTNSDLSVYLQLDEFGDDDRTRDREIRVAFFFSLLNADGTAGYANGMRKLKINCNDFFFETHTFSMFCRMFQMRMYGDEKGASVYVYILPITY